jgi:hypothetical protein
MNENTYTNLYAAAAAALLEFDSLAPDAPAIQKWYPIIDELASMFEQMETPADAL